MGRHLGLALLFLLVATALVHAAEVRGVHPSDASLYSGSTFSCKDRSKTGLPLSKVNDDYCDCKDGSDEPGTSACENGRFFCPNRGHIGVSLFSSRVNDGICDCCDGSDEYDGKVKCENTCYALGEGTRSAKRAEIEAFKKGLEIRRQYEAQARAEREQKQRRLDELQEELVQKEKLKSDLQAQIALLEDKAKAAEELLAKYKPKETPAEGQDAQPEPADDEEDAEEYDDGEEDVEDEEDAGQAPEAQEEPKVLLERTDDVKEALEQAEKDVQEYKRALKGGEGEEAKGVLSGVWRFLGLGSSSSPLPLEELKMSDLKELRQQRNNAQNDVDRTATEINNIEEYLKLDLREDAFHGIRGQTFELQTNQYTYKLTPFKEVRQQHTRLGDWGSWLNPEHTKMEYSGGERCWNGPDRKTIVVLSCSDTNRVLSVQEPNKCEYEMLFNTPAACAPDRLALLEQELAALESPEDVVLPLNTNDIF